MACVAGLVVFGFAAATASADQLVTGSITSATGQKLEGVLPALLEKLPREHRVPHSEQYMTKDPLGHAFLAPSYVVAYAQGKQDSKLVVSVANSVN